MILLLPVVLLVAVLTAGGVGLFLAALNVRYRDVRYVVPFLVQLWMFASPVIYPASLVPARWRWLYHLNPMAGVIDGFRAALLGFDAPWAELAERLGVSVVLAWIGVAYFRRVERRVADLL